jgi:hypothetical protein
LFAPPGNAQDTAKQKIKCWVKCCPLEIGCQFNSARTASKTEPNADITVAGDQLVADFKPTGDQKVYEVKAETKLDASTAEALGFKEITLLPGQYAIAPLRNGRAKVSIKVRTVAAKGKKADSTN